MTRKADMVVNIIKKGDPEYQEEIKLTTMGDAMNLAMQRARTIDDDDPDPYGYGQELEEQFGIDLLTPNWKAKPDDLTWVKRVKGRARKAAVSKLFLQGYNVQEISTKVAVSEVTVHKDLENLGREWRKSYLADIEVLAGKDLARLEEYLKKLAPGIENGNTKSIQQAVEIIKTRAQILGYQQGVQVNIEQYIREVAASAGYDPDKAVEIATRISYSFK